LFYHNKLKNIRKKLWKNEKLVQWGRLENYFERDEFQNRGTIHTHGFAYTELNTPELIAANTIRADVPDPILEPELYLLVTTYQVHQCHPERCGGPKLNNEPCKKGFPCPLSETTHKDNNSLRYIYRRTKPEDRWIVPYHPETLLIWRGHINFQYITSRGFAKYVTKYVTKPEPSEIFDIDDQDSYRKHIQGRKLGAMELMILLLQYEITRCTIKVQYLPSAPSNMRIRAVKPIHMQLKESETPYWDDAIDKYFERPRNDTFNNMTYPQYFRDYNLKTKPPAQNTKSLPWTTDQKNRYVIKRKKPVLLRFATYKINDGETFFFQHLILKIPCYSEEELLGEHSTYRERFRTQFPHQYKHAITEINNTLIANKLHISTAYKNIIEEIVPDLKNHDLQRLIFQQLMTLEHQPPLTDPNSTLCLNEDQYKIYDMLSNTWGPENKEKYPYFFMTGPAGTGKSYMTHQIIQLLKSKNINHLLIAPTGVAAQNIGGKTIYSALKIKQCGSNYQTLSISDETTKTSLRKIRAIIIDKVSMVSSDLLSFLS